MATYYGNIDTYFVNILSPKAYGGKRRMNIKGNFGIAHLIFYPLGEALPNNRKRPDQHVFDIYYNIDSWEAVLDVLRNEGPLTFLYSDISNTAQIYTGNEPVGEGEA